MVGVAARINAARYAKRRGVPLRRGSKLMIVSRSMINYKHRMTDKDAALLERMRAVSKEHPTWGHRLVHGWLVAHGETVSLFRVRRLWTKHGLSAQWRKRRKKRRTGARLNPEPTAPNMVWCMDFAEDRLQNGRKVFALLVKDEATAFGLEIAVARSFKGKDVEQVLDMLVDRYGAPQYARSDNGGQFIAGVLQIWAKKKGIQLAYIDPGKPWQNGSAESFVGTYRREVLDAEIFMSIEDAEVISQKWRRMYNEERPHSKLGYRTPSTAYPLKNMSNSQHS